MWGRPLDSRGETATESIASVAELRLRAKNGDNQKKAETNVNVIIEDIPDISGIPNRARQHSRKARKEDANIGFKSAYEECR